MRLRGKLKRPKEQGELHDDKYVDFLYRWCIVSKRGSPPVEGAFRNLFCQPRSNARGAERIQRLFAVRASGMNTGYRCIQRCVAMGCLRELYPRHWCYESDMQHSMGTISGSSCRLTAVSETPPVTGVVVIAVPEEQIVRHHVRIGLFPCCLILTLRSGRLLRCSRHSLQPRSARAFKFILSSYIQGNDQQ